MLGKDPVSVFERGIHEERFLEADVISIIPETRKANVRLRKTSQEVQVNLGTIDPQAVTNDRARLLIYASPMGGGLFPIATIQNKIASTGNTRVSLGDRYGATSWGIVNSGGQIVFEVDSLGQATFGTYGTYYPSATYLSDEPFVTTASSSLLTSERVLTAGDGIDVTVGAPGTTATVTVDVTDILGSGLTESSNNIDLDWGTPTITTIQPDDSANAGTSTNPARSDHVHAITADAPGTIQPDDIADEGVATYFSRSDHTHGIVCAAPETYLSVSTLPIEGSATYFARSDHVHGIITNSNPGAAASILASSAAGKLTLVDLALSSLTASTAIYANASKEIESLANAAGYLKNDGAGSLSWDAAVAGNHDILSATHTDSAAAAVTDGDIIIGNATPAWSELAISVPAANVRNVLGVDNGETRPNWKAALDGNNPTTLTVSTVAAPGTSLVFSHRDHAHAITSSSNPGANARILASDASGYLRTEGLYVGVVADSKAAIRTFKQVSSGDGYGGFFFGDADGATANVHGVYAAGASLSGSPSTVHGATGVTVCTGSNLGTGYGVTGRNLVYSGYTVTTGYALYASAPFLEDGTAHITNAYGLRIESITQGDTLNYAIYTGDGLVRFGDDVTIATLTASTLIYSNASKAITSLANASGYLKNDGAGALSWESVGAGDEPYVTASASGNLSAERVLTAGDGIDITDGGVNSTITVDVDVTDLLGSGLTESLNNIDLNWGTPTIGTIECDDSAAAGSSTNPARSDHQHAIVCAAPGSNLTVSTTNAEGSASSFSRSDHSHAITSSSNPGANARILASDASGYLRTEGLYVGYAPYAAAAIRTTKTSSGSTVYGAWLQGVGSSGGASGIGVYAVGNSGGTGTTTITGINGVASATGANATSGRGVTGRAMAYAGLTLSYGYAFYAQAPYVEDATAHVTYAYGLRVEDITQGDTSNYAIWTGTGLVRFGDDVGINVVPTAPLHVDQSDSSGAVPVAKLDQGDTDEPFIDYIGTSAADQTKSISTVNGDGAVEGPKNYSTTAGWAFEGMIRVAINGTDRWIPYYSEDTS